MHRVHYTSQDIDETRAAVPTWSVYCEFYATKDAAEPIEGLTRHVSTHPTQAEADAEANRLDKTV